MEYMVEYMVESMRRDGDVDNVEGGVDRAVDVE